MTGMNARTGRRMDEDDHIRQSIRKILTTPIGSRIKRREFGSLLPDLIDHPTHPANRLRLRAATIMALLRWEPRIYPRSASVAVDIDGSIVVDLDVVRRSGPRAGTAARLTVPLR